MRLVERLIAEIAIRCEEPFVMRSQLRALAKQMPLLYVTLCTNALALAFTHFQAAPIVLTLAAPGILIPVCVLRIVAWRRMRIDDLSDAAVAYQLRRTMLLVALLGVSFTGWSLALFSYGDAYAKAHVAFFMSITVVGCIFCLIHLRPAALALTAIVVVPFTIRFLGSGETVLMAIAVNFLIVAVVMAFMLLAYYDDFRRLVHSMEDLARLSDANRQAAHVDSLTGLANRRRFYDDIEDAIAEHAAAQARFALGLLDLDGFKPINDLHGHQAGDQVLVEVSRRLEAAAGAEVTVARLGGDEFGLIVPHSADHGADVQAVGRAILDAIARPIPLEGGSVSVTASLGFAFFPDMGRSHDQLAERADFALYHAKERCRGSAVFFNDEHATEIRERRQLEHELRHADLDREFSLMFQPMVDSGTNGIIGFEALARWTSPVLGSVSPALFIPAAERIGIVKDLTRILFQKACDAARRWPDSICLSFNLSVDDLMDDESSRRLTAMVRACGLAPERIVLEITETAIMHDFNHASVTLEALRALGCRIALDDFGTGYSSLSYVHRLPLDKLKIDQSFVRSVTRERTSRTIIKTIVDLSENLGIACIIEGVETSEEIEILKEIGCVSMQGYYFGRPMTQEQVLLRTGVVTRHDRHAGLAA